MKSDIKYIHQLLTSKNIQEEQQGKRKIFNRKMKENDAMTVLAPSSTGYPDSSQPLGCKFVSRIPLHLQQPSPLLEALKKLSVQNIMMTHKLRGASGQPLPLVINQPTLQMGEVAQHMAGLQPLLLTE